MLSRLPLFLFLLGSGWLAQVGHADTGEQLYQQHCALCHSNPETKAPTLSTLQQMPMSRVMIAMEFGRMAGQAANLDSPGKTAVAAWLAQAQAATAPWLESHQCTETMSAGNSSSSHGWGHGPGNPRFTANSTLNSGNAAALELAWSLAIPGATEMRSQPLVLGNTLYLGTQNGNVLALDQASGCVYWRFKARSSIRSAIVYGTAADGSEQLFFADDLGSVYALAAATGKLRWQASYRWFKTSVVSGSPAYYDGKLYVPLSTYENALAADPRYPCCSSHGGVLALNADNGEEIWQFHTTEAATQQWTSVADTPMYGPSGASVWSTPAIDAKRGRLYLGTGNNTSEPATDGSDAIVAVNLADGSLAWRFQATAGDVWNSACWFGGPSCKAVGPDVDFGASVVIAQNSSGDDVLLAGQKAGMVYALDPDNNGAVLWQRQLSQGTTNGGIHWGLASHGNTVVATVADPPRKRAGYVPRPGVYALDISTGAQRWQHQVARDCAFSAADAPKPGLAAMSDGKPASPWPECSYYYGHSAAPLWVNDVIIAGALDGKVRFLDAGNGRLLASYNTNMPLTASNGITGHGGAIDVSGVQVAGEYVYVSSGYGMFGQIPGNLLLAYKVN